VIDPIRYLSAERKTEDDFGVTFIMQPGEYVYDARVIGTTKWACMSQASFNRFTDHKLGVGLGQRYQRNEEGHLIQVKYEPLMAYGLGVDAFWNELSESDNPYTHQPERNDWLSGHFNAYRESLSGEVL